MASASGSATLPESNAGAFPLEPSPVIQSTSQDSDNERLSRAQKPRPLPRKDGARPADITVGDNLNPASSLRNTSAAAAVASGRRNSSPFSSGTSPSRIGKSSPRHLSPATSQIFERDVQESTILAPELSPAIPSHMATEDHIPPVLEASSLAITDNLDPDEVEIVMHTAHQPAATTVAQSTLGDHHPSAHASHSDLANSHASLPGGLAEALPPGAQPIPRSSPPPNLPHEGSQEESTYSAIDPTDPRRLSFISFADVVNAEHAEMAHSQSFSDSTLLSQSSAPSTTGRSPSPARSPLLQSSPPRNVLTGHVGHEASPVRGGGSSVHTSHGQHGELTIETMRQTLQKTGSGDVGGGSQPMSATSAEDLKGEGLLR